MEFDDHVVLSEYAFFSFEAIHQERIELILEAFRQKYPERGWVTG